MTILVTGGAGFIGTNFVLDWIAASDELLINVDKLTYAGNLRNLQAVADNPQHVFVRADIADEDAVASLLTTHRPRAIVHFAAETHVDRSIHGPEDFIRTNVLGTFRLLAAALQFWQSLQGEERQEFRLLNISTDEVFGSLAANRAPASETSRYAPNSPYAASKAAADHLVRSYFHTYGLPTLTTHCTNNYGPFQFPEKLIPLMIANGTQGKSLPIYGDGQNVRDWLHVTDHCTALREVLLHGEPGEVYNIAGNCEMTNVDVVETVCSQLDELLPDAPHKPHGKLIEFVKDRPGHDRRYALSTGKIEQQLGWQPQETFASGLQKTVKWYLDNQPWLDEVTSGEYRQWLDLNYAGRPQAE